MAMPSRGGITTINYDTIEKLYASYLPFIENGALFIPTNQQQQLGSQTFVAITLPNSSERMPLHGKVVWVNHRAQAQRPAGFVDHGASCAGAKDDRKSARGRRFRV